MLLASYHFNDKLTMQHTHFLRMTWYSGPHECDGPWASWWYADVHKSNGWTVKSNGGDPASETPSSTRYRTLNPAYTAALRASIPAYDYLKRLTRRYQLRGPPPQQIYEDPRNEHILVYIGAPGRGQIVPRDMASVSPFDSSVQGGDAAWEGLRIYRGNILSLNKHLRRLFRSAKALGFQNVHTKKQVVEAIFQVCAANGMRDGAHMRLTLTRGEKCTSSMNPSFNVYGTTLIILPEWKPTEGATTYDNRAGISLISASQRRNTPQTVDSKIHHNNLINNILPKIQANLAGCADAIMLDVEGFVSETNATNIFMVDDEGILLTPHADHCLPGITRASVLQLAQELNIPTEVRRVSLAEFHAAEEVFTTGTMGELTPVVNIDGRIIGSGCRGPITEQLQAAYQTLPEREGWATPLPPFE
jgi:protein-lysine N-methyltransferase EEF2KMT